MGKIVGSQTQVPKKKLTFIQKKWDKEGGVGCSIPKTLIEFGQGQSNFKWLKTPLVSIQNPGSKKFQEVKVRGFNRLITFLHVVPDVLSFFLQTGHSQLDLCNYYYDKTHWNQRVVRLSYCQFVRKMEEKVCTCIVTFIQLSLSWLWKELQENRKYFKKH